MSLLDNMPHRCTIRRRTRAGGSLGGSRDAYEDERTGVECWEQNAGHGEVVQYDKRGIAITHKIYFPADPGVSERHQILVTEMDGAAISDPVPLDVRSEAVPDASAGMGVVWKVVCEQTTGSDD